MNIRLIGFDWDYGNLKKCQKHGLSQADIEALFHSPEVSISGDVAHSQHEPRFFAFGTTDEDRAVLVVYTLRDKEGMTCIRPISARYMHEKERKAYEKEIP